MSTNTGSNQPFSLGHHGLELPRFGYRPDGTWGQLYYGLGLPTALPDPELDAEMQAEVERDNALWEQEQREMAGGE